MDIIFDCPQTVFGYSPILANNVYLSEIYPSLYLENSPNSSKLKETKDLHKKNQKKKRVNEEKKTSTPLL